MKKVLCTLLACSLVATAAVGFSGCGCSDSTSNKPGYTVPVTEPDLKNDEFGFTIINDNELMVTTYLGDSTEIVFPESFNGYTVTTIGKFIFSRADITSVEIPDTVKEIQDHAFASCKSLTSVKLPKNLETLGTNVFFNCRNLKSIELPSTLKNIDVYAFAAAGFESVTIPESDVFTSLGEYMFYQCQDLKEVTIPATVKSIPDSAFADCPNPLTFKVEKGSYAQEYAEKNNFAVEATE